MSWMNNKVNRMNPGYGKKKQIQLYSANNIQDNNYLEVWLLIIYLLIYIKFISYNLNLGKCTIAIISIYTMGHK